MQEGIRKETDEMSDVVNTSREAEALSILRMLDKAIKEGKDIEQFRAELDAYIDGLQKK